MLIFGFVFFLTGLLFHRSLFQLLYLFHFLFLSFLSFSLLMLFSFPFLFNLSLLLFYSFKIALFLSLSLDLSLSFFLLFSLSFSLPSSSLLFFSHFFPSISLFLPFSYFLGSVPFTPIFLLLFPIFFSLEIFRVRSFLMVVLNLFHSFLKVSVFLFLFLSFVKKLSRINQLWTFFFFFLLPLKFLFGCFGEVFFKLLSALLIHSVIM